MDTVGERIKRLRKDNGMTQKEFAEAIGVARSTLAGYETNQITPSISTIFEMSTQFNVIPAYFLRTINVKIPEVTDYYNVIDELDKIIERVMHHHVNVIGTDIKPKTLPSELLCHDLIQAKKNIIQHVKMVEGKSSK